MNRAMTEEERKNADAFHAPLGKAGIAAALAKAQAKIKAAVKDSDNPAFKIGGKVSKYADLAAVWEACRAPLSENGLSIVQTTEFDEKDVWLVTTLLHSSGESISGRYPLRPVKSDPQGFGSAITYARRYTIAALVGVVADEDDDGNAASRGNGQTQQPGNGHISGEQVETIRNLIEDTKSNPEKFCTYFGVKSIPELPAREYRRAIESLNTKLHPKGTPRPSEHEH